MPKHTFSMKCRAQASQTRAALLYFCKDGSHTLHQTFNKPLVSTYHGAGPWRSPAGMEVCRDRQKPFSARREGGRAGMMDGQPLRVDNDNKEEHTHWCRAKRPGGACQGRKGHLAKGRHGACLEPDLLRLIPNL